MAWLILLVACLSLAWGATVMEDWRRDLTTNWAQTDAEGPDPSLRPLRSQQTPSAQAERIAKWAKAQRNWSLENVEPSDGKANPAGAIRIHLVRRTPWLRFRDDIHVTLTPTPEGGSLLEAHSRSRIGKGDLGQNPRNLRELLRGLAE